jgi:hypothetical protein
VAAAIGVHYCDSKKLEIEYGPYLLKYNPLGLPAHIATQVAVRKFEDAPTPAEGGVLTLFKHKGISLGSHSVWLDHF